MKKRLNRLKTLEDENRELKEIHSFYHSRLEKIMIRSNTPHAMSNNSSSSSIASKRNALNALIQKFELLKEEEKTVTKKFFKKIPDGADELIFQKHNLMEKIKEAKKNNENLKKKITNTLQIKKKNYLELLENVKNLEKKHLENLEHLEPKKDPEKVQEIDPNATKILSEIELSHAKLCKYYRILTKTRKVNHIKFQQKVKEFEEIDGKLSNQLTCLQLKFLKVKQQERLLDLAKSQVSNLGLSHNFTDPNFLYKPSVNGLYH